MKKILALLFCVGICATNPYAKGGDTMTGLTGLNRLLNIQATTTKLPDGTTVNALDYLKKIRNSVKITDKNKAVGAVLKNIKYGLLPLIDQLLGKVEGSTLTPGALYELANFAGDKMPKIQTAITGYLQDVIQPKVTLLDLLTLLIAPEPQATTPPNAKAVVIPASFGDDF